MELKELREKYNITEAEMAGMMGMSVGNYQRLERGRRGLTKGHRATMALVDQLYRLRISLVEQSIETCLFPAV
jgi:transcriptional regulator with XRE-family HTH domain